MYTYDINSKDIKRNRVKNDSLSPPSLSSSLYLKAVISFLWVLSELVH